VFRLIGRVCHIEHIVGSVPDLVAHRRAGLGAALVFDMADQLEPSAARLHRTSCPRGQSRPRGAQPACRRAVASALPRLATVLPASAPITTRPCCTYLGS
jgi:hypothetical protein